MNFQAKNAIITGGSSGIGLATAKLLAERGANIAIIARRQSLLDAALAELESLRRSETQRFQTVSADLSLWEEAQAALATVTDKHRPDLLINSAGIARPGYFVELPIEIFRETMDVDFFGTLHACKVVAPMMMTQGHGHIVNISSGAGFLGIFGYTAYGAAKFAVRGFSDALRAELKPHGVRVSIVFPPDTDTPQLHEENRYKPPETRRISGRIKPIPPEQVAQAIVQAIEKNRYTVIPGAELAIYYHLTNGIQALVHHYMDWIIAGTNEHADGPQR